MKNFRQIPLPASFEGICICGGKFYVFEKPAAVAHSVPQCKAFEDLQPDDFLAYIRREKEKERNGL